MHILQLAGGQVWPNFLPLLAFKPAKATFLTSSDADQRYLQAITDLADTLANMGVPLEFDLVSTKDRYPTIRECLEKLNSTGSSFDLCNLTGGTKPMCLAAHQFAHEQNIPAFYLDTRRTKTSPFENAGTGTAAIDFPDLESVIDKITVHHALAAQGFPVPGHFKKPAGGQIEFGCYAAELRSDAKRDRVIKNSLSSLRKVLHPKGDFLRKGALRAELQNTIHAEPGSPYQQYLQRAADCNILAATDNKEEFYLTTLDPITSSSDDLKRAAERNFKLLEGIWFELALYRFLEEKSSFTDIAWSVEGDTSSRGETDLVAFNSKTLNLHFISCKTSGPQGAALDHIQGLRQRADKEGGKFSKAELWIFRPRSSKHREDLASHCRENKVKLCIYTEMATRTP